MRKLISMLAVMMLLLSSAGFAVAQEEGEVLNQEAYELYLAAEDNTLPICAPGKITLKIYVELDEYAANFMQSYDEHPVVKKVEELTGVFAKLKLSQMSTKSVAPQKS